MSDERPIEEIIGWYKGVARWAPLDGTWRVRADVDDLADWLEAQHRVVTIRPASRPEGHWIVAMRLRHEEWESASSSTHTAPKILLALEAAVRKVAEIQSPPTGGPE